MPNSALPAAMQLGNKLQILPNSELWGCHTQPINYFTVKFGMGQWTYGMLFHTELHLKWCTMTPLWGQQPQA